MNVSELLDAAETHLAKGRHAAAETLFTEAMVRTGGAVRALAGLGTIALHAGDVRKAEDLFGRALALAPEDAGLLVGMATVHLHAQRAEEAETCLRRAMRLEPTLPAAPANLALVLLSRHDLDGARALARRALELAPDSPDMLVSLANVETLRGAVGAARSLLEKAAALAPDRADVAVGRATLCQLAGDLPAAVQSLERARLLEPDAPSVLARLAECRVALGELEEARRLVRQAVAVAPAVCEIRNAEGVVLMHTGHHAEALASFRLAAQCNPRDPAPLVNLALLMRRNHQMDAALAAVRQAIALAEHVDAAARRLEIDLLWLAGEWREAWRRHDELRTLVQAPGSVATAPDEGVADSGSSVALIVDDLSCALMGLGLLPRLATADRRTRLLCLPAYASFFRSLPGIDIVQGCESIDLSRDIEPGEVAIAARRPRASAASHARAPRADRTGRRGTASGHRARASWSGRLPRRGSVVGRHAGRTRSADAAERVARHPRPASGAGAGNTPGAARRPDSRRADRQRNGGAPRHGADPPVARPGRRGGRRGRPPCGQPALSDSGGMSARHSLVLAAVRAAADAVVSHRTSRRARPRRRLERPGRGL